MLLPTLVLPLLVAGCDRAAEPCTPDIAVWEDDDGDGWGGAPIGKVCEVEEGQVEVAQDCDDADDTLNPSAIETCDGIDNDCDGRVDDDASQKQWWWDGDGDGFGSLYQSQLTCQRPEGAWVANHDDCDDRDPAVNPEAQEVCGRVDEDCDGYIDEADDSVDPESFSTFYADDDGDGYGDKDDTIELCRLIPGYVLAGDDCDDNTAALTQVDYWEDDDGDGYGDPAALVRACRRPPAGTVDNDDDCDDTDPSILDMRDWFEDIDGDGFGSGVSVGFSCVQPVPYSTSIDGDCDEDDPDINPDAVDTCGDGFDANCSGSDDCSSCLALLDGDPSLPSGVYAIQPTVGVETDVWCDMTTDGGGWTLVASTHLTTLDDAGTSTAFADLATLTPSAGHSSVWDGMRPVMEAGTGNSDIRFACKVSTSAASFSVDLSFYDMQWYMEITTGTDADSCFSENTGLGADPPPARRNNLTGAFLAAGDQWNYGYLEGEDSCTDVSDFTVDFDDRGMDSNQVDGTDWGEDDGTGKCGVTNGQSWFIFVREL